MHSEGGLVDKCMSEPKHGLACSSVLNYISVDPKYYLRIHAKDSLRRFHDEMLRINKFQATGSNIHLFVNEVV